MKRKLEAELMSIAHRILKLKNKSELAELQQETLKLYEKISVLRFVEENFSEVKPTIGYASAEKEVEAIYEAEENSETDTLVENGLEETENSEIKFEESEVPEILAQADDFPAEDNLEEVTSEKDDEPEVEPPVEDEESITEEEEVIAAASEIVEDIDDEKAEESEILEDESEIEFAPLFEISKDEKPEIVLPKQITLEDFLSDVHVEPIFVRAEQSCVNETITIKNTPDEKKTVTKVKVFESKKTQIVIDHHEPKTVSLNDSLSKSINIGLNDRIGFEKHLFDGSSEDLNRVLSQLSTYANFSEANDFIEDMVKPDYNNWKGKEEYEARFMEIVEKKFS
jgi:hypothetical protein